MLPGSENPGPGSKSPKGEGRLPRGLTLVGQGVQAASETHLADSGAELAGPAPALGRRRARGKQTHLWQTFPWHAAEERTREKSVEVF